MATVKSPVAEDVGNVLSMEHVNLTVADPRIAEIFYITTMGFTRDPFIVFGSGNMWVNVGEQQFHVPSRKLNQVVPGHIGVVMPDLESLKKRLQNAEEHLADTKFSWSADEGKVNVTGPWGNHFRVHEPSAEFGQMALGLPYVEFKVKRGAADGIAQFYQQVMKAPAKVSQEEGEATTHVYIGLKQELIFRETDKKLPPYDGHHVAVYVANFSEPYEFFKKNDILMEDITMNQFRFKEIVHPKTGELLTELEHEVRSLRHPMFQRDLINRDPAQGFVTYVRGMDQLNPLKRS
jgi:hypothetical protein